jgi:hypothetical protein
MSGIGSVPSIQMYSALYTTGGHHSSGFELSMLPAIAAHQPRCAPRDEAQVGTGAFPIRCITVNGV